MQANDLQSLIAFYQSAAQLSGRKTTDDLLEDGKLGYLSLPCPMCSSGEGDCERLAFGEEMYFNFADHSFGCNECDASYTPEEILEELKEKADILVEHLEGFALLLPRLRFKA